MEFKEGRGIPHFADSVRNDGFIFLKIGNETLG